MDQNTLLKTAENYLHDMRGRWKEIEDATGLSKAWMAKIAQGKRGGPDVNKIERLLRYAGLFPCQCCGCSNENKAA